MQVKIGTALMQPRLRSLQEAIAELQRELDVRKRCFSRWVAEGKVSEIDAIDRYERLDSAISILIAYQLLEEDKKADAVALPTSATGG